MLPGIEMNYSTPAPIYIFSIEICTKQNIKINTYVITRTANFIFLFHSVVYFLSISIYFYDILE